MIYFICFNFVVYFIHFFLRENWDYSRLPRVPLCTFRMKQWITELNPCPLLFQFILCILLQGKAHSLLFWSTFPSLGSYKRSLIRELQEPNINWSAIHEDYSETCLRSTLIFWNKILIHHYTGSGKRKTLPKKHFGILQLGPVLNYFLGWTPLLQHHKSYGN